MFTRQMLPFLDSSGWSNMPRLAVTADLGQLRPFGQMLALYWTHSCGNKDGFELASHNKGTFFFLLGAESMDIPGFLKECSAWRVNVACKRPSFFFFKYI